MLFVLQTRLRKRWNNVFQISFVFLIFASFFMSGLYSIANNVAYAQTINTNPVQPNTQTNTMLYTQTSAQNPISTISEKSSLPIVQGTQNPINMTVSTTINTSQAQINPQIQSVNIPVQNQISAIIPQSMIFQNPISRSTYGQTPSAPSLERNIYLDSVWTALVPRRQLYTDPARKMQKPRANNFIAPKKKISAQKQISKEIQENTKQGGKIKLKSGSQISIQPGSHVTVFADSPTNSTQKGIKEVRF